jgi:hypothetical protein
MAVVIPYVENTAWADGSGGGTPITAAKLNVVEDGISNAHLMPAVRVFHNATQSITTVTATVLAFNSERFDQAGGAASTQHDTVTNNSRLTCRYAGIYHIAANVGWQSSTATGFRQVRIRLNGTTYIAGVQGDAGQASTIYQSVSTLYALSVNDYVETVVDHSQGTSINVLATSNYSPEFMMVRVA